MLTFIAMIDFTTNDNFSYMLASIGNFDFCVDGNSATIIILSTDNRL